MELESRRLLKLYAVLSLVKGKLTYKGQDISQDSIVERSERIGFVLQNPNQMISQTMIFDEVALGLRLRGIEETEVEERVHEGTEDLWPL